MPNTLSHIAIIPDGNRRWAKQKGKPSFEGHRFAVSNTMPKLFDTVQDMGIPYCTVWLLSPENFIKRSQKEIHNLLYLIRHYMRMRVKELDRKNVQMKIIGDISSLPENLQKELYIAVERTKRNTGTVITFALNYGGRDEMLRAMKKIQSSKLKIQNCTKQAFEKYLDTYNIPDPDLVIRTGGERRTSGFMLWQAEYAEYAFLDTLFPDMTPQDLRACVAEFLHRQRRFGK